MVIMAAQAARVVRVAQAGPSVGQAGPIGRQAAQRLARQELSKAIYHPHESFLTWLNHQLDRLFNSASGAVPGGWWTLVALAAAAVLIAAFVFARVGPVASSRRQASTGLLGGARPMTAQQHRELAENLAQAGDYSGAVLEYVRAIAVGLEERAIILPGPGRTADEFAAEAGRLVPALAAELTAASQLFDDIRYGGRDGTRDGYELVRDLDHAVREASPISDAGLPGRAGRTLTGSPA
jgi:hypothetical protein